MSKPLSVALTDEQQDHLRQLTRAGNAPARVQTRARILLLADRSQGQRRTHQQITQALSVSGVTISAICRRFVLEGIDAALYERPRPGQVPKITGEVEAQLVLLACSEPPQGQARWTMQLLADKLVELQLVESISDSAVCERLKKPDQAVEGCALLHRQALRPVCSQNGGCSVGLRTSL
jgi:transposase